MRRVALLFLFFFLMQGIRGQEIWSLDRCIQKGLEANLTIKSADLNMSSAELEQKRWFYAALPSLNANMSYGYQFGRTIDPTTNSFIESTTNFTNGQLNAAMVLFDGFRIRNSKEQARLNALASRESLEDVKNNSALQIATAYINVLFAEEQMEINRNQLALANTQLEQISRLVEIGLRPENEEFAVQSQVAQSGYQLVLQENIRDQAYLSLKQLMFVDPSMPLQIQRPDFNPADLEDPSVLRADAIYNIAVQTQPMVKAAQFSEESALKGESIARAGMIPSLRLFGGLSSAFSNNFLDFQNPDLSNAMLVPGTSQVVQINGVDQVLTPYTLEGIEFNTVPFWDQLNRNFGRNIGVSLQVPLYNNHNTRIGMQQARINAEQSKIQSEQVRQQLKVTIESAAQSARAARQQYLAAGEALSSQEAAFQAASRRYELGAGNLVEFTTAKTNLDQAQNQAVIAKYEYLFRMKVLDFYMGKKLTLN